MSPTNGTATGGQKRPNILMILVDDMGYTDLGCYGGEIQTPNIDRLAAEGIRLSDYHTSPLCSPTRSMILSGTDSHMAGVGVMAEFRTFDPKRWDIPGHEGYLNHDVAALPEVLQDAGYHTIMSGKWHLGVKPGHTPHERGFDKSWSMLLGGNNHFGWEPVLQELRTNMPFASNIVRNVSKGYQNSLTNYQPRLYAEEGQRWEPEPNTTQSKDGFYSTSFYTDKLISYLDNRTTDEKEKPFFAYLAHSAPHFPLQCFSDDRAKYKGRYDAGPDALRLERVERAKKLGIVAEDCIPHPVTIKKKHGWTGNEFEQMTDWEKMMTCGAMEVYAGMIDKIDQETGRLMDYLERTGQKDDTLIMFFSDNGAAGAALEANITMGERLLRAIDKYFDNSEGNLGNYNSFLWLGPRWAQASTAPNRVYKSYVTEGGIRVPMVIKYPKWMSPQHPPGSICRAFTTCMDLMPTFLDMAGHEHPNAHPKHPRDKVPYRGHMVYPMRGKSWLPYFEKGVVSGNTESEAVHAVSDEPVGWEMHGRASLRHGKWKIVNMPEGEYGTGSWELYDMSKDQGEVDDLAQQHPEILEDLLTKFGKWKGETGAVFGEHVNYEGGRKPLAGTIAGDPTEDWKAWMKVGLGKDLSEQAAAA